MKKQLKNISRIMKEETRQYLLFMKKLSFNYHSKTACFIASKSITKLWSK